MIRLVLFTVLLFSTVAVSDGRKHTINIIGDSCQICVDGGLIEVCKFYKKCPIKEKREHGRVHAE